MSSISHLFVFQTDCTISLKDQVGENYVLAATLDEFNDLRMKKNMSDAMKYQEKVKEISNLNSNQHSHSRWNVTKLFSTLLIKSTAVM